MPVKVKSHPCIHSKTEVVRKTLQQMFLVRFGLLVDHVDYSIPVAFLHNIPTIFMGHYLNIPHIKLLDLGLLDLHNKAVEVTEIVGE